MQFNSWKLSPISLALAASLLSTPVLAGDIKGKVTDSQNKVYFDGALVEIKETKQKQVTKRDGSFIFKDLTDGQYTIQITYLGAEPVEYPINIKDGQIVEQNFVIGNEQAALENIIVYGQQAGQAGALNRQKNAKTLKSVVSSDAIGQFPDQNAAEALQRLPGMFIQRDQGEGRFVGIRGIDPNLNNLTINGTNIASPESGVRSVAMDVIPSELIEGLEVSKTVTPDMDADAIGGSIEVKSLSAFDREDGSYSVTVQGSYNEQTEDSSPKLSGSYTEIFELDSGNRLGVAAALSWFEREFGSHNIETDGGWFDVEFEDKNSGEDVEGFGAEEVEQRHYLITRERTGAAINFDLQTQSGDKYYLRTLYSQFSDDEFRLRNEYKFEKGQVDAATWSATSGDFVDAEMDRDTKDRYEEQEILSVVLGGENQFDHWLVEYNLGYSKSTEDEPNRIDADFAGEGFNLGYSTVGDKPALYQDAAAHDLANFELDEIAFENNHTEDEELSFKIDLTRDFVWNNHNGQLKFGAKHRSREKSNRPDVVIYDGGFDDASALNFAANTPDWDHGNFGPGLSKAAIRSFFFQNQSGFEVNGLDSQIDSLSDAYSSEEDITAAYGMVSLDVDSWHIVAGLRYESTDFSTQGNKVELIVDEINDDEQVVIDTWSGEQDYDHLFPSVNIRYDISDKLVTRFAYTETLARPSFSDSAAKQVIESETVEDDGQIITERKAEVGNPDLKPFESSNLDFSIEYYPGQIGVMSAGLFYKDIDNYIVVKEVQDNGLWDGYEEVLQPVNGGSASISGIELAWTKNFDSGLLISANGTWTDADDEMPSQSDTVGNLTLGYENRHLSARLTLSHKSEAYQFTDSDYDVFEDSHNQVDFNLKYFVNDNATIYFNAINLTDEAYYLYHGNSQYNYQYETYGSTFELGFTYNSF
ncbi:TonB-dependent receptor [Catenovulum sp. SM1970]|uniref:TonB-dependent receptor n=1 Tax=Marinifaba aquimaris TaxID=2741323 RepID=UPI0015721E3E|nr:TonB-dependent receptor [Marinifaba aquimaris]NTS77625.1 TonB-dependent receptor [Marinifaba aquimaris]